MCKPEFPTNFQELYAIFHVLHFSKLDSDNDSVPHLLLFFFFVYSTRMESFHVDKSTSTSKFFAKLGIIMNQLLVLVS